MACIAQWLSVFQFAISVILIIATIVVNSQMKYMLGNKLGFKKDHVIVVERTDLVEDQFPAFKNEMLAVSGVQFASGTNTMPVIRTFLEQHGRSWDQNLQ
jgi:putative ABC transport system permease protein